MRLMVWKVDQGPGDEDFKAGDIWLVYPNTWVPGSKETIKTLVVEMEDYGGSWDELTASEYMVTADTSVNAVRHLRKHYIDLTTLNPANAAKYLDPMIPTPIMVGIWGLSDIKRK